MHTVWASPAYSVLVKFTEKKLGKFAAVIDRYHCKSTCSLEY